MHHRAENKLTQCLAALDRAIGKVARDQFNSLCRRQNSSYVISNVANSLRELRRLADPAGASPAYNDPWVALFYVLWYQPGQTYLAYRLLSQLAEKRKTGSLRIIDFGCGALATEIAISIALCTNTLRKASLPLWTVRVDSIDSSQPMIELGKLIANEMLSDPEWPHSERISLSKYHRIEPDQVGYRSVFPHDDCWLTAFHTVYEDTQKQVKKDLMTIDEWTCVDHFISTTHKSKQDLLQCINLFSSQLRPYYISNSMRCSDDLSLPKLPHLKCAREGILQYVESKRDSAEHAKDVQLIKNYLGNTPIWTQSIRDSTVRIGNRMDDV